MWLVGVAGRLRPVRMGPWMQILDAGSTGRLEDRKEMVAQE